MKERSADDTAATEARRPIDAGRELGGGKPVPRVYSQAKGRAPLTYPGICCRNKVTTPRQSLTDNPRHTEADLKRMLLHRLRRVDRLLYTTESRKGPYEKSLQVGNELYMLNKDL